MPQMANITVKKNDGTTDVVYTQTAPSAGDKSPAVWRNNAVGTAPAFRPELRVSSQFNGTKTARRVEGSYMFPSIATGSDGKISVVDRCLLSFSAVVPQGMLDSDINEAAAQGLNLFASVLIKQSVQSGFSPT